MATTDTITTTTPSDLDNWRNAASNRFDFGQNAYLEAIPDLSYSMGAAKAIGGLQSRSAMDQYLLSNNLATRRGQFDGMEDQYAKTAFETNNEANQQRVAGQAAADISQQFGSLKGQTDRDLARKGVNPNSGRALAMGNQMAIAQAGASAGAQNKARQDLDVLADSRQRTAIGFGAPLTGQAMSAAQNSNAIGNSAIASAASPLTQRLNFAGGISNLYGNAVNDYNGLWSSQNLTAAQLADQNAANAARDTSENNALLGTLGSLAGGWASGGFKMPW